jgi:hypothetical protein
VPERGLSSPWREKDLSAREWRGPLTRETHRRPRGDARREDAGEPARGRPRYLGNQWRNEA